MDAYAQAVSGAGWSRVGSLLAARAAHRCDGAARSSSALGRSLPTQSSGQMLREGSRPVRPRARVVADRLRSPLHGEIEAFPRASPPSRTTQPPGWKRRGSSGPARAASRYAVRAPAAGSRARGMDADQLRSLCGTVERNLPRRRLRTDASRSPGSWSSACPPALRSERPEERSASPGQPDAPTGTPAPAARPPCPPRWRRLPSPSPSRQRTAGIGPTWAGPQP
jgi:hypothetical protein